MTKEPLDLAALRARLAGRRGKEYWRSLEELAETADFQDLLRHEFPQGADIWEATLSRRGFLKVMGASMAMAGLTGCAFSPPEEKIVPYVKKPEAMVPGIPLFFATAMPLGGYATGILVRSNEGRPTKVEGNPDHPASLGATDVYAQASILSLYDPDRSQGVLKDGQPSKWEDFVGALNGVLATQRGKGGAGLRILTETVTSPTLIAQIQTLLQQFPQAKWYQYEPGGGDGARVGAQQAFGQPVNTIYNFDQANIVVSLDSNFMLTAPGRVRYARQFMAGRLVRDGRKQMSRLYAVESTPSITGAQADHRLPLKASQIETFARALAQALGVNAGSQSAAPASVPADWLPGLVKDLQANRGKSIVIAGEDQPAAVHALAHAINATLGNAGTSVIYTAPAEANPSDQLAGLRELTGDMAGGKVEVLLMLDSNPAYSTLVDLDFAGALAKVGFRAHLGTHADETAALSTWHIPAAHYLESWGDARAFDGSVSLIQPLIAPIWGGKTVHDLLAALLGQTTNGYDAVRAYWQNQQKLTGDAFETFWRTNLNKGIIAGTALPAATVTLKPDFLNSQLPIPNAEGLELTFRLDPSIWDGRFANNGWLQELPKPLTTLTWDNVAMVSPKLAEQQILQNGDVIELSYKGRKLSAPVWIMPGQPDESIAITLGYGRSKAGSVGDGAGFNAYALRTADAPNFGGGLSISKVGDGFILANTQKHYALEGRDLIRHATLEEFLQNPSFAHEGAESHGPQPSLYPDFPYNGSKWGMVIDTQACISCNACVIACQSENNIAVVGKDQVSRSREMHWLKIDTYFEGDLANPATLFQPRMCMHCENAPCEVVCPVQATVHDHEGLNSMVYNRCVGTRYCSNNCPYKVRRYNFLQYSKNDIPLIELSYNPEVTVRNRGVMEKCTYCVQRISVARIASDHDNRPIADGEVITACQQACPTNAIVFGDLNIASSQVAQLKAQELSYGLLEELNTKPRTSYMPRVRNPNHAIKEVGDGV